MTSEATAHGEAGALVRNRRGILGRFLPLGRGVAVRHKGTRSKALGGEQGATLVEFALASTVMLTMLFGVIVVGLAVYSYDFTAEAARDAVRYAIVRGANCSLEATSAFGCGADNAAIQTHVQGLGYPGIKTTSLTTSTKWYTATVTGTPPNTTTVWTTLCATDTYSAACAKPGNAVQVTVSYPFPLNVPFVPATTINMSNSSMMAISN